MTKRNILIVARLFFGLLTLTAIFIQLGIQIHNGYSVVNFFSYFTNLSNIFAAVVLIIGAIYLITNRVPTPNEELIRGASVLGMAIVGVVFSLLLRDVDLGSLLPWINFVLHYLMPVVVVADWLIQPPKSRLVIQRTAYWLVFPLLYLAYTLIRGPIAKFYPYPFLNPANGGYGVVALYCLAILVLFLVFGYVLMYLANRLSTSSVSTTSNA